MAYSYVNYTGNGSTTQFSVPMPYIRKEHVRVYINNVEQSFTWLTSTTVLLASAPVNGAVVQVRRITPVLLPLVDFADGSTFVSADLDVSNLQHLYIEQELDDSDKQAIYVDPATGQLTAGSQKIGNVGTPTLSSDAATKGYVDTADAAVAAAAAADAAAAAASATSANAAKIAAEAARDQTLATYDNFDDRYLGPKASDPTLDNDGNALVGGALYFNTTAGQMRLWTGTIWVAAYVSGTASAIGFTPVGNVAAANVQSAIQEVDSEKMPYTGGTFTGSITFANGQTFPGTFLSTGGTITGNVTLNGQSGLRFADSDSSKWVAFQAPATIASNITWTLPNADGTSGQSLTTNGSGALSWSTITPTIASRSDVDGVHTTGTVTSGSASLTVASATGIVQGMVVVGEGITPGTTVSTIVSTTVTLSANAGATLSSDPVGFYDNTKALSPGSVGGQLCRAWVNFNGTSTVAIRASFNVSSITDNGTGDYTVNFTTAMPDANYQICTAIGPAPGTATSGTYTLLVKSVVDVTTTSVAVRAHRSTVGFLDLDICNVAIFR